MKKSILNLGKALNKVEQKNVNGGTQYYCPGGYNPPGVVLPRCPAFCIQGNCLF